MKQGYFINILGYEKIIESEIELQETLKEYKTILKANQYIRTTQENGKTVINIVRHYKNKQDAIKNAILNKNINVYDLKSGKNIPLTKKVYILYYYNKYNQDISYQREFTSIEEMEKATQKTYNTLKSYIIKSLNEPIKELLQDHYIIVSENALIEDF